MIKLPLLPKIIKKEDNKAIFEIEALHPGYGITIGNSLRRVLLSSLEGAAVVQMKIKGVSHEFSTIPGVLEDVINIMLNLKQLRFKLFTPEPQKITLKAKGEKKVKGADFELSAQIELINKNLHIATLTSKSSQLEIELQIEQGIGYSARDSRQKEKLEIGAIPLDAIFTPVKKVSYKVENMIVGKRTDYDRLFLEIETDGTISPEQAFWQACEILTKHFAPFIESFKPQSPSLEKEVSAKKDKKKKVLKIRKKTKKPKKALSPSSAKKKNEKKKKRKKTK